MLKNWLLSGSFIINPHIPLRGGSGLSISNHLLDESPVANPGKEMVPAYLDKKRIHHSMLSLQKDKEPGIYSALGLGPGPGGNRQSPDVPHLLSLLSGVLLQYRPQVSVLNLREDPARRM
jgi:hypothetical protein